MAPSIASHLPPVHRRIRRSCAVVIGFFLALHALHWLPAFELPGSSVVGFLLHAELFVFGVTAFLAPVLILGVWLPLGAGALFSERVRSLLGAQVDAPDGSRRFAFAPWLHSFGWVVLVFAHLGLDIDPAIAAAGYAGLLLLLPSFWGVVRRVNASLAGRFSFVVVGATGLVFFVPGATDGGRTAALVLLAAFLLAIHHGLGRFLALRDRFLLATYVLIGLQGLSAVWPLYSQPEGAEVLGAGRASSFVECGGRLFVAVPRCSADLSGIERCRSRSTVDEFVRGAKSDEARFERRARHRFFSDDHAGRVAQLGCFGDRVSVGMDFALDRGETLRQSAFEFEVDDPARFSLNVLGDASGNGFAYDPKREVAYYRSEAVPLIRRELATGRQDRGIAEGSGLGSVVDLGFDGDRDRLLAAGGFGRLLELDAGSHAVEGSHPFLQTWGLRVDPSKQRVYLAGNWGFEAIDLASGGVIARHRIGFGGLRPALDACNHVIYVPSTVSARLQAFDRLTLEPLGSLPLGPGLEQVYVSPDGERLFAGGVAGHYSWDARRLAQELRGGESPPAPPDPGCRRAAGSLPADEPARSLDSEDAARGHAG